MAPILHFSFTMGLFTLLKEKNSVPYFLNQDRPSDLLLPRENHGCDSVADSSLGLEFKPIQAYSRMRDHVKRR